MVGSKAWETDGIISSNPPYCSNPLAYKIQSCVHYKVICFPDASHCFPISSRTSICSSLQKKFNSFLMSTTCCAHQGCHSCFGSPLQTQSARSVFCRRSKQCQPLQLEWVPDEVQLKNLARAIMMQVLEVPVVPDDSQACPVDISTVPDESLSPQRGKRTSHVTGWLGVVFFMTFVQTSPWVLPKATCNFRKFFGISEANLENKYDLPDSLIAACFFVQTSWKQPSFQKT